MNTMFDVSSHVYQSKCSLFKFVFIIADRPTMASAMPTVNKLPRVSVSFSGTLFSFRITDCRHHLTLMPDTQASWFVQKLFCFSTFFAIFLNGISNLTSIPICVLCAGVRQFELAQHFQFRFLLIRNWISIFCFCSVHTCLMSLISFGHCIAGCQRQPKIISQIGTNSQ